MTTYRFIIESYMHSSYKFSTIVPFIWQDAAKEEKVYFPLSLIIFMRVKNDSI